MRASDPTPRIVSVAEARDQWNRLVEAISHEHQQVVVEQDGCPVVAIISPDDLERLRRYDAQRAKRFTIIDEMRAAFADVPDEEIEREVERAIEEARARRRAERGQVAHPA